MPLTEEQQRKRRWYTEVFDISEAASNDVMQIFDTGPSKIASNDRAAAELRQRLLDDGFALDQDSYELAAAVLQEVGANFQTALLKQANIPQNLQIWLAYVLATCFVLIGNAMRPPQIVGEGGETK